MTKCAEFYEKLERDGNFCGISTRFFREAMTYWNEYRKDVEASGGEISPLSEGEWFKQRREQAKKTTPTEEVPEEVPNNDSKEAKAPSLRELLKNTSEAEGMEVKDTEEKRLNRMLAQFIVMYKDIGKSKEDVITIFHDLLEGLYPEERGKN